MAINTRKTASVALICIAIANLLLFGFGVFGPLRFWLVLAAIALAAFLVSRRK